MAFLCAALFRNLMTFLQNKIIATRGKALVCADIRLKSFAFDNLKPSGSCWACADLSGQELCRFLLSLPLFIALLEGKNDPAGGFGL